MFLTGKNSNKLAFMNLSWSNYWHLKFSSPSGRVGKLTRQTKEELGYTEQQNKVQSRQGSGTEQSTDVVCPTVYDDVTCGRKREREREEGRR